MVKVEQGAEQKTPIEEPAADVVTEQPAALGVPDRRVFPTCPAGLENLAAANTLIVKQEVGLLEVLTGYESANHYSILNESGQLVYYAAEESDCLSRACCGPNRAFDIRIVDLSRKEVLRFSRPLRCLGGCCGGCCTPCCLQRLEVSRDEQLVGVLTQDVSVCSRSFSVRSPLGDTQLHIRRRCCTCACCCADFQFKIQSADGRHDVGRLTKQWKGLLAEASTDADNFCVQFPSDMDIGVKATVLGAVFLIDFMYFEGRDRDG